MFSNIIRQSNHYTKNICVWKINRLKIDCHNSFPENIDSHDNSLYKNNRSIKSIVKDYNERWDEDITIEQYLKKFTRKHRGGC